MAIFNSETKCIIDANDLKTAEELIDRGYVFADRTIQTSINLKHVGEIGSMCRLPLERLNEPNERIYEIALDSFQSDSRFFATMPPNNQSRRQLIRAYVDEINVVYVCRYKGEIIGFIEVIDIENASGGADGFVRLAAVDEKYRRTGAALSMYAGVVRLYREKGYGKILGRISGRNMSVMNVYRVLGASFANPEDVYIIRCNH